ncbi:cysteine sulfinate desulfinase/cysteine desulfurase-like protein [Pseudomonas psychrotolerans]|nr:cysteine sulfinate desulfinase/cysteine desulfurase-like protein [Pseudomonas psychrotolerans]
MDALPLYFDYAATTPVDDAVIEAMLGCLGRQSVFGNPASRGHAFGNDAQHAVDKARQEVAELVGAQPEQLIWTSGATESNNLALLGVARRRGQGHLITSCLEHRAVLDTAAQLEAEGFAVTYLTPNEQGLITADAVAQAWRDDTFLVSLMLVNNELGTLTDIASIGTQVRARGALFHVDAAQATGKVAIDLARLDVDLMSFSAHKTYGPKGIGALYVGPRAEGALQAQIHGGGHERGLRSGTLATHQIVGMGTAFVLAGQAMVRENERLTGPARPLSGRRARPARYAPERLCPAAHPPHPEPDLRHRAGHRLPATPASLLHHLGLQLGQGRAFPCPPRAGSGRGPGSAQLQVQPGSLHHRAGRGPGHRSDPGTCCPAEALLGLISPG